MPASAQTSAADSSGEPPGHAVANCPRLTVDVQFAEGIELPLGCDFALWAGRCFRHCVDAGWAADWMARSASFEVTELCIRLVDDAEGKALNATWRDKDAATNVLSFPADIVVGEVATLGDLVICVPVVEREALLQNKSQPDHYAHLCVHGVFHLLGYDHIVEAEAEIMEAREVAVLRELNVANPYD